MLRFGGHWTVEVLLSILVSGQLTSGGVYFEPDHAIQWLKRTSADHDSRNCVKITSLRILRGGQNVDDPAQSKAYLRHLQNIKEFAKVVNSFEKQVDKDFPADDVIGESDRGIPLGTVPNPHRCEMDPEPKTVDNLELSSNHLLKEEYLDEAMKAVDFLESFANSVSPEGIEEMLNARGMKLEDLSPTLNSAGTRMGNLTLHDQIRASILNQVQEIRTTHALLRHEMSKPSPIDELHTEIEEVSPQSGRCIAYVMAITSFATDPTRESSKSLYPTSTRLAKEERRGKRKWILLAPISCNQKTSYVSATRPERSSSASGHTNVENSASVH
jgi:hypothetical protein